MNNHILEGSSFIGSLEFHSTLLNGVLIDDIFVNQSKTGHRTIVFKKPCGGLYANTLYRNKPKSFEEMALWHDIGVLLTRKKAA